MREYKYILDKKGNPVPEPDVLKWGKWFEDGKQRIVKSTIVGNQRVSTVFLGCDMSFGGDEPILFETMVFETKTHESVDEYANRYITREEAVKDHDKIVKKLQHESVSRKQK